MRPCRGQATGSTAVPMTASSHIQRQLSQAGSLALAAVEEHESISALFMCVFVTCVAGPSGCVYRYI